MITPGGLQLVGGVGRLIGQSRSGTHHYHQLSEMLASNDRSRAFANVSRMPTRAQPAATSSRPPRIIAKPTAGVDGIGPRFAAPAAACSPKRNRASAPMLMTENPSEPPIDVSVPRTPTDLRSSVASKWGSMAPPDTEIDTNPNASQTPKMTSSSSWRAPLLLVTATATLKTSMAASTTGRAMRTFARSSCHIVSGARRRSWKPLRSLGIEGVARAEDMNIERNVTNATLDQNPLRLRAGWVSAAA